MASLIIVFIYSLFKNANKNKSDFWIFIFIISSDCFISAKFGINAQIQSWKALIFQLNEKKDNNKCLLDINVFANFFEIQSLPVQVIKENTNPRISP